MSSRLHNAVDDVGPAGSPGEDALQACDDAVQTQDAALQEVATLQQEVAAAEVVTATAEEGAEPPLPLPPVGSGATTTSAAAPTSSALSSTQSPVFSRGLASTPEPVRNERKRTRK